MTVVFRSDLDCLLCGRTAGVVRVADKKVSEIIAAPTQPSDVVCQMRCPCCYGRLVAREFSLEPPTRTVPPEEPVKRGPKPRSRPRLKHFSPCADCRQPTGRTGAVRCRPCMVRHRDEGAMASRLIVLLGHGRPMPRREIQDAIGCTYNGLRNVINRARKRHGVTITLERGHYRMTLETTP